MCLLCIVGVPSYNSNQTSVNRNVNPNANVNINASNMGQSSGIHPNESNINRPVNSQDYAQSLYLNSSNLQMNNAQMASNAQKTNIMSNQMNRNMEYRPQSQQSGGHVAQSNSMKPSGSVYLNEQAIQQLDHKPTPWQHNGSDYSASRAEMAARIITILQHRRPHANQDWQQKLPQMAKRLEEALFTQASSFDEYMEQSTTKQRLQWLAQSMGSVKKDSSGKPVQSGAYRPQGQVTYPQQNNVHHAQNTGSSGHPQNAQSGNHQGSVSSQGGDPRQYQQQQQMNAQKSDATQNQQSHNGAAKPKQFINMAQINPLLVAQPSSGPASKPTNNPTGQSAASQNNNTTNINNNNGSAALSRPSHHTEEHRKQVLKQQQQRLLLLRHASKCPHEADTCSVTPHCANMKNLWSHIMSCKDQECKVAHCVSSRYVLSHYSKCKDSNCPVCGPVREAIRRNYERSHTIINTGKRNLQQQREGGSNLAHEVGADGKAMQSKGSAFISSSGDSVSKRQRIETQAKLVLSIPKAKDTDKLDPISCPLYCMTNEEINAHMKNIHEGVKFTATSIRQMLVPIIDHLFNNIQHVHALFSVPVDPEALGLPDYFDVIKSPMDLGTIKKKLEAGNYRDMEAVASDVRLTFNNALKFNAKHTDVYAVAKNALKEFDAKYKATLAKHDQEVSTHRTMENYCMVCAEKGLKFEPPVYYCNGRCGLKIRRGSNFYHSANNLYHWCNQCFNELLDGQEIPLPDCTLTKAELAANKKKHTEDSEEPWVACDNCDGWVHQLCALFNGRRNIGEVPFLCPKCLLNRRSKGMEIMKTDKKFKAEDLPHSNLSSFIEKRIYELLDRKYSEAASKLDIPLDEVDKAPTMFLRQVTSLDKNQAVREGMVERYKEKKYPQEFPCRTKCLILFQKIDGQDVLLFGMYVYEYGHKCPQPNQRRVYISYLDSVHYFRPKQYRTAVYHEIIVAYLEYVKARGFHTAHIWACPPLKGDDYILYCHPSDQKNPKDDRLRKWYVDMLEVCKQRGIVHEVVNIYAEYLANTSNDCTVMPYFEGDYWVNEAEVIIKDLATKKGGGNLLTDGSNEKGRKSKKNKSKMKSRSSGAPDPLPVAVTPGVVAGERDAVMAKLASIIEPMKDAFFVVRLWPQEYADRKARERAEEIVREEKENDGSKDAEQSEKLEKEALADSSTSLADIDRMNKKAKRLQPRYKTRNTNSSNNLEAMDAEGGDKELTEEEEKARLTEAEDAAESETFRQMSMDNPFGNEGEKEEGDAAEVKDKNVSVSTVPMHRSNSLAMDIGGMDAAAESKTATETVDTEVSAKEENSASVAPSNSVAESKTIPAETDVKTEPKVEMCAPCSKSWVPTQLPELLKLKDDTEDVDDIQESDQFDTRQSLLNLCQGNHYQFDQLRRAKHSTMMLLYHIQNPDAPKFVPNCAHCHAEILVGIKYRCDGCDVDYCQMCVSSFGKAIHKHSLAPVNVGSNQLAAQLTEEQKKERQKNAQLHLQLLLHASGCVNKECSSKNCAKMKVIELKYAYVNMFYIIVNSFYLCLLMMCL